MLPALDDGQVTLAFMDARGYGASKAMTGPFDMQTMASDARGLADELGWDRFAVVGHSMGGKAALRLAVDSPERISRMLVLTPVWAAAAPFDAQGLGLFRAAATNIPTRAAILDNTTGGRLPKAWSRAQAIASARVSTPEAFAAYFESWALEDFSAETRNLALETLVVVGAHDAGVTEEGVRASWLSTLTNAHLHVMAETGHYPMLEAPLLLASLIERFLAGHDPRC
jgi:pimeloyl-ACP methyl ester carboxylesterase